MRRLLPVVGAIALLAATGCKKINIEKSYDLEPGDNSNKILIIDPPSREQQIVVTATSSEANIGVLILKGNDEKAIEQKPEKLRSEGAILAEKSGEKTITLEATIPAKTPYMVMVSLMENKKSAVKLTVKGK